MLIPARSIGLDTGVVERRAQRLGQLEDEPPPACPRGASLVALLPSMNASLFVTIRPHPSSC